MTSDDENSISLEDKLPKGRFAKGHFKDVGMGGWSSGTASDPPLVSTGFGSCYGLLVLAHNHEQQPEATLFHISCELSSSQKKRLQQINLYKGNKYAVVIADNQNHDGMHIVTPYPYIKKTEENVKRLVKGVTFNPPLLYPHGHMDIAYELADNMLELSNHNDYKNTTYTVFSEEQLSSLGDAVGRGK